MVIIKKLVLRLFILFCCAGRVYSLSPDKVDMLSIAEQIKIQKICLEMREKNMPMTVEEYYKLKQNGKDDLIKKFEKEFGKKIKVQKTDISNMYDGYSSSPDVDYLPSIELHKINNIFYQKKEKGIKLFYETVQDIIKQAGEKGIIYSLGQSPAYFVSSVKYLDKNYFLGRCRYIAASKIGSMHNVTDKDKIGIYKKYLVSLGLSPKKLKEKYENKEKIILVEYCHTGKGLNGFLKFLENWAKENKIKKVILQSVIKLYVLKEIEEKNYYPNDTFTYIINYVDKEKYLKYDTIERHLLACITSSFSAGFVGYEQSFGAGYLKCKPSDTEKDRFLPKFPPKDWNNLEKVFGKFNNSKNIRLITFMILNKLDESNYISKMA